MSRCNHLTVDEPLLVGTVTVTIRRCLFCGVGYVRCSVLRELRADILERHRLPPSPWSAQERSEDPWS